MKKLTVVLLVVFLVGGGLYYLLVRDKKIEFESVTSEPKGELKMDKGGEAVVDKKVYSLEEVALHDKADDCWIAIGGKVYDVTEFVSSHPGGKAILEGCGKDATELYETRPMGSGTPHSSRARDLLSKYLIGELK